MSFPLYDILLKESTNDDLSLEQKKELTDIIPSIDNKGHQNIFTIIRMHGLKTNSGNIFDIPYDGKKIVRDIKFNVDKLPNVVKQMLYRFVKIHIEKTNEVQSLSSTN